MIYDVVLVGGGPAGLAAALTLGRARKRVLLCDAGPRRNAAATHIHNFVTRDGTPPDEFRAVGRAQLATYPNVTVEGTHVVAITGERGAFQVTLADAVVEARRVLLCTGMIDEMLPIDGFAALWGSAIFQCPYCHGWEVRGQRWAYLLGAADAAHFLPFALKLRGWTDDLLVLSHGATIDDAARAELSAAGVRLETEPVSRIVAREGGLDAIVLANGTSIARDVLFAHPPQKQVALIETLGVALENGFVRIDPMTRETSIPGIYAGGDAASRMQGAIFAAAAAVHAAAMINTELTRDLATSGRLVLEGRA